MLLNYYRTTILVTILQLIQQAIMLQYHYDTTAYYVTILPLIQQAPPLPFLLIQLLRHYNPIDTASYYVTILLSNNNLTLLYSNRYRKLICYYTSIDATLYYVIILPLIQPTIMLLLSY